MQIVKKSSLAIAVLAMTSLFATASAQTNKEAVIKKLVEPKLSANAKIDSVTKTPYLGLYEIQVGDTLFYTDEKASYLFVGNILDLKNQKNLTRERLDKLTGMKIADMPLELALKQVNGNGKRELAIFEDPNCGYCKQLRKELQKIDNLTIYTFMYDILSEDSAIKSKNVWCSADPSKAWNELMLNGKAPATAPASCTTTPHEKILALGAKLHVNATPAIFFKDGSRITGFVNTTKLEEKLASIK